MKEVCRKRDVYLKTGGEIRLAKSAFNDICTLREFGKQTAFVIEKLISLNGVGFVIVVAKVRLRFSQSRTH